MTALYLSGPMSGLPEFNYPAFRETAGVLRAYGYAVLDPSEVARPGKDPEWGDWMRSALRLLLQADAVAVLPGWNLSRGARLEVTMAQGLGMDCKAAAVWMNEADVTPWQAVGRLQARAELLEETKQQKGA